MAATPAAPQAIDREGSGDWRASATMPVAMLVAATAPAGSLPAPHVVLDWAQLGKANSVEAGSGWSPAVQGSAVHVPLANVEAALRLGIAEVTWGELVAWTQPPNPDLKLVFPADRLFRLPLAALAEAYLRLRAQAIPGDAAQPPAKPADTPPPTAAPAAAPPTTCQPGEFISMVALIPGVEGALLASTDGLPLAAHLPSGLDRDTLSAFLPRLGTQIFAQAKPFGVLKTDSVVYHFEDLSLAVFHMNDLLVAVFGARLSENALQRVRSLVATTRFS
jgi:hypothetical protein